MRRGMWCSSSSLSISPWAVPSTRIARCFPAPVFGAELCANARMVFRSRRHMIDRRDVAGRRFPEAASDSRSRIAFPDSRALRVCSSRFCTVKVIPSAACCWSAICNKGSSVIWLISVIPIVKLRWLCWGRNSGLTAKSLSASWRRVEMVGRSRPLAASGSSAARPGQTAGQQNDLVVFQQKAAGGLADIERVRCWGNIAQAVERREKA